MVRTRYVGPPGALAGGPLAGMAAIERGHPVDMPERLARVLIAQGLFVLEEDYPAHEQAFVEIARDGTGGKAFAEVAPDATRGQARDGTSRREGRPLVAGDLQGLGEFRREALAGAGVESWQALAALSDEDCQELAGSLVGISAAQMTMWRNEARAAGY